MKQTLIKLALISSTLALIACGDGMEANRSLAESVLHQVSDNNNIAVIIEVQQTINAYNPVKDDELLVCPQNSTNQCGDAPYKLPPHRVINTPDNSITCIRDDNPLILVNGVLTDNCGNKYGITL